MNLRRKIIGAPSKRRLDLRIVVWLVWIARPFRAESVRDLHLLAHTPGITEIRRHVIRGGLLVARKQRSGELRRLTSFEITERIE